MQTASVWIIGSKMLCIQPLNLLCMTSDKLVCTVDAKQQASEVGYAIVSCKAELI